LGLDLERFDSDRRSEAVLASVRGDFESGIRAGVVTTPTLFAGGQKLAGQLDAEALDVLSAGS
jgi:protein-disulfide isomerase